jgi:hypothetical protein
MLGDSLSTTVHHGLEGRASSRSSAVLAGWMLAEAPAAFSRVDAIRCSESTDVTSISSPSSIVGLSKAAADMVMQSPPAACSSVFNISPVSVLSGKSPFFWLLRIVEISYRSSFLQMSGSATRSGLQIEGTFLLLQHGWAPVCSTFLSEKFSWSYFGHRSCFIFLSYWRSIMKLDIFSRI